MKKMLVAVALTTPMFAMAAADGKPASVNHNHVDQVTYEVKISSGADVIFASKAVTFDERSVHVETFNPNRVAAMIPSESVPQVTPGIQVEIQPLVAKNGTILSRLNIKVNDHGSGFVAEQRLATASGEKVALPLLTTVDQNGKPQQYTLTLVAETKAINL